MVNSNNEDLVPDDKPPSFGINRAGGGIREQAEGSDCLETFAEGTVGPCVLPTRFLMADREKPNNSMFSGGSLLLRQVGKYLKNGRCFQLKPRLVFWSAL